MGPDLQAYAHNESAADADPRNRDNKLTVVAVAQGGFYVLTGLWPLVSLKTFEKVTGPKGDHWLVKTVGVLVTVAGTALLLAGVRRRVGAEAVVLAVGSAAGLSAIDLTYVLRRRVSPIYILDAVTEIGLIGAWALAWRGMPRSMERV